MYTTYRHERTSRHRTQGGQSVIEVTLLAPWIFFLFMAIVDLGFFSYATIATENAARIAALFAAESYDPDSPVLSDDVLRACNHARNELRMLPNYSSFDVNCAGAPLAVDVVEIAESASADGEKAIEVAVTYQTIQLIPVPGLQGQLNITRRVQMRPEQL